MYQEELLQAGLTGNEAKIYTTLISNADLSASEITKQTGIHRRNVYDALNRLLEKGLVNETLVQNKKRFNAIHPQRLLSLVDEQRTKIQNIVPTLAEQFSHVKKKRNFIKMYKGTEGIKASFNESLNMLKEREVIHIIGGINMRKILGEGFMDDHHKERQKKSIRTNTLFNYIHRNRPKSLLRNKRYHYKVLPKDYYLPVQTVIYGDDIVCQILFHEEPFVIQVIDKAFADNFKRYFKMLWGLSN
jgi:sugar-specific transcriptional regulator TrmB